MTRGALAEMVENEAQLAEAEDDADAEDEAEAEAETTEEGDEEGDEDEGEPEARAAPALVPEPPEPPLGAIGPEEIRKAEKARDGQRKRLAGILGADYVAHECIFCSGLGFAPEPPPLGAAFLIVPDGDGVTFEVQPPTSDIPLLAAPDKEGCPECDGYGEVLSGSKSPHAMVTPCSKCAGNGWVMVARQEAAAPVAYFPDAVPGTPAPAYTGNMGPDAWGRPGGHQHWGVPPANVPG